MGFAPWLARRAIPKPFCAPISKPFCAPMPTPFGTELPPPQTHASAPTPFQPQIAWFKAGSALNAMADAFSKAPKQ